MTMWGFSSRKDDDGLAECETPKSASQGKRGKRRIGRRRKKQSNDGSDEPTVEEVASPPTAPVPVPRPTLEEQAGLNVSETGQGIEILLDWNSDKLDTSKSLCGQKSFVPVISLVAQISQRQKVYRAQFSVFFQVLEIHKKATKSEILDNAQRRTNNHRVPINGRDTSSDKMSYNQMFQLLQNAGVKDEITSVRVELKRMTSEINSLEEDKAMLDKQLRQPGAAAFSSTLDRKNKESVDYDIHRLLSSKEKITSEEKKKLEIRRGLCLTINLQNPKAEEAFLSQCGAKNARARNNKRKAPGSRITLDPDNCRSGGAGAAVQHFSIMKGSDSSSAFFLSRDSGKSFTWGHLPPKLFWRMKHNGIHPENADLVYLSTGPKGSYYAEFRSGECWWGCAGEDKEFHSILQDWDVYRVVFGSFVTFTAGNGKEILTTSWLILGRDGRAAWKNIPSRLHQTLESRLANSAAPAEVALGSGESYYVRFLDGTVDYCLPADMASVCEQIEKSGGTITDMALNPEMSHEFIVRHTEVR